jgi:hypothetical protein
MALKVADVPVTLEEVVAIYKRAVRAVQQNDSPPPASAATARRVKRLGPAALGRTWAWPSGAMLRAISYYVFVAAALAVVCYHLYKMQA